MSKLSPREKNLLIVAAIVILFGSLIRWFLLPALDEYGRVKEALEKVKLDYTKSLNIAKMEKDFQERYTAYHQTYQELKTHYFKKTDINDGVLEFLGLLEEIAERSGVTIVSKNPAGSSEKNDYRVMKINLALKGTTEELTELLLAIRNSPIAINVDYLRIDLDRQNRLLQMKLNLSTLLLEEEENDDAK